MREEGIAERKEHQENLGLKGKNKAVQGEHISCTWASKEDLEIIRRKCKGAPFKVGGGHTQLSI